MPADVDVESWTAGSALVLIAHGCWADLSNGSALDKIDGPVHHAFSHVPSSNNISLPDWLPIQHAIITKAAEVDRLEAACGQQLGHRPTSPRDNE